MCSFCLKGGITSNTAVLADADRMREMLLKLNPEDTIPRADMCLRLYDVNSYYPSEYKDSNIHSSIVLNYNLFSFIV